MYLNVKDGNSYFLFENQKTDPNQDIKQDLCLCDLFILLLGVGEDWLAIKHVIKICLLIPCFHFGLCIWKRKLSIFESFNKISTAFPVITVFICHSQYKRKIKENVKKNKNKKNNFYSILTLSLRIWVLTFD